MEFKVNSKELDKVLTKLIPVVPSKSPMKILESFHLSIKDGRLTVSATDLEIYLRSSLNIAADSDISFAVPAKLLFDIVRSLKDSEITVEIKGDGKVSLVTKSGRYSLSYFQDSEYPEFLDFKEDEEDKVSIEIPGNDLKDAIDRTSYAIAKEEMRPAMQGTLFEFTPEGLNLVATDGHRLVKFTLKTIVFDKEKKCIIPEKATSVLGKILDERVISCAFGKNLASFNFGDLEVVTRFIGAKYPDYNNVIPLENEFRLTIGPKEMQEVVKRMMLVSTGNTKRVKLSLSETVLELSAEDADQGVSAIDSIACKYEGDIFEIGFNSQYLNDLLTHSLGSKEITFKLHSATKAVVASPSEIQEGTELTMLLMPVRINN